jgi:DNA replication initiation complex subunit (GINS family)
MDDEEISYKTLRRIQQAEKSSPQITQISKNFYTDVSSFLRSLEHRLTNEKKPQKQMLLAEETQNIEKIIRNIYEQREKKIMLAAIARARGGNPNIKLLVPDEKRLFDELYQQIVLFRKKILSSELQEQENTSSDEQIEKKQNDTEIKTTKSEEDEEKKMPKKKLDNHLILRILEDIPSFIGTDNNTYTLHKSDVISLPEDMAMMLLNRKVAKKVQPS